MHIRTDEVFFSGIILFVYISVLISESFSLWLFLLENVPNHYPQFFNQCNVKMRSDSAHFFEKMTKVNNFLILSHLIPGKDAKAVLGVFGSSVCNIFLSQHWEVLSRNFKPSLHWIAWEMVGRNKAKNICILFLSWMIELCWYTGKKSLNFEEN